MNIKHNSLIIPKDGTNPFLNDKLDRKKYADVLTSIVSNYADGFVLAINNKWGTGKTTFVKMWEQDLKNAEFQTLYFNAWENDFQPEVLVALLAELSDLKDKGKSNFDLLVKSGAKFLSKAAPAVAKGIASKLIGEGAIGEIVEAATELTTEELENQIQSFTDAKKGIIEFRTCLEKFVAKVNNGKPVIFIIDELDRCRPNYAVSVLEEIKHLFSVPGIVFVLSIDKEQLGHAIKGVYGSEFIDSEEYLRRFIDLEYKIPSPNRQMFIEYMIDYYDFNSFVNSSERQKQPEFQNDRDNLRSISILLFSQDNFTLRQIEKNFSRIRLTINTFSERQFIFPDMVVLLSYLYDKHPEIYRKIENTEYSLQELVDVFDPIFKLFKGTTIELRKVLALYASLLNKYSIQLYKMQKSTSPLINSGNGERVSLKVDSKLEDEDHNLAKLISYYQSQFDTNDIELNFIQKRYSLSENLR